MTQLNLGCGDRYAAGWENVDLPSTPHPKDRALDLTGQLPWPARSVTRVYAGHLLEHLEPADCARLLRELRVSCQLGATLLTVGPDCDEADAMVRAGTFDYLHHSPESLLHGASRWPGDEHHWRCTGRAVRRLLRDAGWVDVRDVGLANVALDWPVADRGPAWQFAVSAVAA